MIYTDRLEDSKYISGRERVSTFGPYMGGPSVDDRVHRQFNCQHSKQALLMLELPADTLRLLAALMRREGNECVCVRVDSM